MCFGYIPHRRRNIVSMGEPTIATADNSPGALNHQGIISSGDKRLVVRKVVRRCFGEGLPGIIILGEELPTGEIKPIPEDERGKIRMASVRLFPGGVTFRR